MMKNKSRVSLVGAGPGDAELITLKGLKAIQKADVILYDALSTDELLEFAQEDAELIYVGKRCGKHSYNQDEINLLLLQTALRYDRVVRLKGGDPFVFGRGHEELSYLRAFDVEVELIPGITSVTSLPLLQEVPLTRRGLSESFWVLTGTTKDHSLSADLKMAVKSNATLVVLMGMKKISEIIQLLTLEDKSQTPIMIVQNGSLPEEQVYVGQVVDIIEKMKSSINKGPGIIIIGEVVSLHPEYVYQYAAELWR